jgi:(1->4)-alpha-D-glucan 1-alpha-D-glucosylmutase
MSAEGPLPRATYRLQLTRDFGFRAAGALAGYLGRLGISHAYLSPILKARSGSMHGYDVVDPAAINPELGTEAAFRDMAARFRAEGVGIILDIVPNHMGIGGSDNPYWLDVLENGEASRFAPWFDIDWTPPEPGLRGKILVPFLDRPLDEALTGGLLELRRDEDGKAAIWVYGHHKLPLAPESLDILADAPADETAIARLLPLQHWRLAAADTGDDEINYRRFFMISDLAGIRIEDDEVFSFVHRLPFRWIAEGLIDGLRVDHIDGLYDPTAYLQKLRASAPRPVFIVVEKILAEDETLPDEWPVEGTTGYEFAGLVTPFLTDPQGEAPVDNFYRQFTGVTETPAEIERASKLRVMDHELAAELNSLAFRLKALADEQRPGHDLTRHALSQALRSVVASLGVYRTYRDGSGLSEADAAWLRTAFADARRRDPDLARRAFDFVESTMVGADAGQTAQDLALRIQQFTGPVMAKGLEDTALYRSNRLISLNDVGERPDRFSVTVEAFHAAMADRLRDQPHGLLGSSTHDSKRGEDARHRIGAISGHAAEWIIAVPQWVELIEGSGAPAIHRDDAYVFFQLLVGAWPGPDLTERLLGAMQKSLREARLRSSWAAPDAAYEAKVEAFLRRALEPSTENAFLESFKRFAARLCHDGAVNGLIATVLKFTVPGVPDIYQGAERWNQMLVDPDNRRPIDFAAAQGQDAAGRPFESLLGDWEDGAVKQALIRRLLTLRAARPALFASGDYVPVATAGSGRLLAFERRYGEDRLFVAARRFPWRGGAAETETVPAPEGRWRDAISGSPVEPGRLVFDDALPFRILTNFGTG